MWAKQKHSGFTIVELLIVVVVIAILAAITIVAFNGVQQRARDSRRSSDVANIKKLLEMYKTDNSTYPAVCAGGDNSGCSVSNLSTALVPTYTQSVPQDPSSPTKTYDYVKGTGPDSYGIYIRGYESTPVCKTGVGIASGWWGSTVPVC